MEWFESTVVHMLSKEPVYSENEKLLLDHYGLSTVAKTAAFPPMIWQLLALEAFKTSQDTMFERAVRRGYLHLETGAPRLTATFETVITL